MDEKRPKPAFRISIMLALLLTALIAALLATWRVRQMSDDKQSWNPAIRPGMTMQEVGKIMVRGYSGNSEKRTYLVEEDYKRREWTTIEITFEDGRVKEVANGRKPFPRPYQYRPLP